MKHFIDDVLDQFDDSITDKIFLMIQNDKKLFHRLLDLIQDRKRHYINGEIAKAIKKRYCLDNKKSGRGKPKSFLIKSFQEFKSKTK